jgi:hypothetical protein
MVELYNIIGRNSRNLGWFQKSVAKYIKQNLIFRNAHKTIYKVKNPNICSFPHSLAQFWYHEYL